MVRLRRLLLAVVLVLSTAVPAAAQWTFTDVTAAAQITHTHGYAAGPAGDEWTFCGGVAAGDYDGDGWTDLFVIAGDAGANLLYRNRGDGTFEDVAAAAGVDDVMLGCGAVFADYDGDGKLDLLVTGFNDAPSKLYRNLGNGTFADASAGLPLTRKNNISATFGDYDRDGDLDLLVTHWTATKITHRPVDEHLWRNEGDGTFTDVGLAAGITAHPTNPDTDKTFTPNFVDIDDDGWLDILLVADFADTQVFTNDGDGTFTSATDPAVITDQNGMGSTLCDYDFDGDIDWYVTSIYNPATGGTGNRLYRNKNGVGTLFEDVTTSTGTREGFWGWGASCQDFDLDGDEDIFHVNGFDNADFQNDPARLFVSDGAGTFTEDSTTRNLDDTGRGLGVVSFDYDRDGDLDIFITNNQAAPKLYRNDGLTRNWLAVKLDGRPPNTQAIGSRVVATIGGTRMTRVIRAGSNYISQDPAEAHFGLASAPAVDTLEVRWFSGGSTTLSNVAANQIVTITEPVDTCGDGVLDAGEECDAGAQNGGVSCCQVDCRIRSAGATCRAEGGACDVVEVCDGASTACPADAFASAGAECRPAADTCDVAEACTGANTACPADVFAPATTECRPAAGVCDIAESCTGLAAACPGDAKSSAECRPVAGLCDLPEICDGVNDTCPVDQVELPGTVCRTAAGVCDLVETCDGVSASCPNDAKSTSLCRGAAGLCDVPETCDGVNDACPGDALQPAGSECRAAAGACDLAEICSGSSPACPTDGFAPAGTECRAAAAICDVAEQCSGTDTACPANGFQPAGVECRPAAGLCDVAESCPGNAPSCPNDVVAAAGTGCRAAAGVCDIAESCDGIAASCPTDAFLDATTECRAAAGECDLAETCTGSAAACPGDAKSTAQCRASQGVCDPAESCDGTGDLCPADDLDDTTECRAAQGACDVAESCDGVDPGCPADLLAPPGTECRAPVDACDLPEACDGFDPTCPPDTGLPDADADGTCDALDVCPAVSDPPQLDDDGDGLGNACDPCTALQPATVTRPLVKLTALTKGFSAQRMKLKGLVTLPAPITPALDPVTHGVRLVIARVGDPRNPLADIVLPGGAYDPATREGWIAGGSGSSFRFKSKSGIEGITKAQLKIKSAALGLVQFSVVAKDADLPLAGADLPLAITLAIDDVAGQCAEYEFELAPNPEPACELKGNGSKILCR